MERPVKEDFEGVNLMNGPYNLSEYSDKLNKYIDQLESNQKVLIDENIKLRIFMWINHNPKCTLGSLYGDDGEMQCSNCKIDFKKDPIDQIIIKLKELTYN